MFEFFPDISFSFVGLQKLGLGFVMNRDFLQTHVTALLGEIMGVMLVMTLTRL